MKTIAVFLAVAFTISAMLIPFNASAQAVVTIEPDTTLQPQETVYVNGTGFPVNSTARIDIVFPSGTTVEGIASNMTDANGTLNITFSSPDQMGDGYVKVVVGTTIVSTPVVFEGTGSFQLDVDYPVEIVADEPATFSVEESDLEDKNYIIEIEVTEPSNSVFWLYHVLHDGKSSFPITFTESGTHSVEMSIENTDYFWEGAIEVEESSSGGGNGGDTNLTITWNIVKTGNRYAINLFQEGTGFIQSGSIRVVNPDGTMVDLALVTGTATLEAEEKGNYQLQYQDGGQLYLETISYNPVVSLQATSFTADGQTSITLLIDGQAPQESISLQVTSDSTSNQITLSNGVGTFTTTETGTYTFSLSHEGLTASTSVTYSETYQIEDFTVRQSENKDYIYVTGKVVGVRSGNGKSDARVQISCAEVNFEQSVKSRSTGSFSCTIPLSSGDKGGFFGGKLVTVEYEYGGDMDDQTISLSRDMWGDYWLWWVILVIFVLIVAKEKGIVFKLTGAFPPSGQKKGTGSGGADPFQNF